MLIIGLMSGTSLDGIDTVLCDIDGEFDQVKVKQIDYFSDPFDEGLKNRVRQIINNKNITTIINCFVTIFRNICIRVVSALCRRIVFAVIVFFILIINIQY